MRLRHGIHLGYCTNIHRGKTGEQTFRGLCDHTLQVRERVAPGYEPPDYFRRLRKEELFSDATRPLEIDLGCGDGTFLVDLAALHPERDFLGIEKLLGRARKVMRKAARASLENVRVWRVESDYAVNYLLPEAGVARLHLLFPDPWPKTRHEKNRLVQEPFCRAVHRMLEPGGEWLFKTDDARYFEDAVNTMRACAMFAEVPWDEGALYPTTDFERQWQGQGKAIYRARFQRE